MIIATAMIRIIIGISKSTAPKETNQSALKYSPAIIINANAI